MKRIEISLQLNCGMHRALSIAMVLIMANGILSCRSKPLYPGPLTPEESIKTFRFSENFVVETFATEPLVTDPVCLEFDEQGNAFVVEMPDANQPDSVKGEGRIVILRDTDGDRIADKRIVFAEGIKNPTSVLPWNGGVLVSAAPDILYYKDMDGDGRADSKEILFTGFFNSNEAAQITSLTYGIDNWIYANNMGQVGEIISPGRPDLGKLSLRGADFRFRPDRNQFERSTGPGQLGLAIDDWGHRFITANSIHIRQVVIPLRYLERNPFLPLSLKPAVENISDHDPFMYQFSETPYWRQIRTDRRNKEFQEKRLDRTEYARGHFTGASGGTFYWGDVLPEEYYGNIFTGDVAGNLVHRDILYGSDSTLFYQAERSASEKSKEFLSSTDSWFRPVSLTTGPDGFLYLVDMYRQHIEDPVSIPDDLEVDIDFSAGITYGRIYRIVPEGKKAGKPLNVNLNTVATKDLPKLLSHPNQWWRLQAQRLIIERRDQSIIPQVRSLFYQNKNAKGRLHALYVLEGLNALDSDIMKSAMKDPAAGLRENAAILSERFQDCLPELITMTEDSVSRVAFQATLSVGQFNNNDVVAALARVVERRGQNPWFRTAILSSDAGSGLELLKIVANPTFSGGTAVWKFSFLESAANVIAARYLKEEMRGLMELISQPKIWEEENIRNALLRGMHTGLERTEGMNESVKDRIKGINIIPERITGRDFDDLKLILLSEFTL